MIEVQGMRYNQFTALIQGNRSKREILDMMNELKINPDEVCTVEPLPDRIKTFQDQSVSIVTMSSGIEYIVQRADEIEKSRV